MSNPFNMRISWITRAPRSAALSIAVAIISTVPFLGHASVPGDPCQGPQGIAAMGSRAQLSVQVNLFIPSYYNTCPSATGSVVYQAATDSAATTAAMQHSQGPDSENFPWLAYSTDLPLSTDEFAYLWLDVAHVISKADPDANPNHLPMMLNGYAIGYNINGCATTKPITLTSSDLASIYSGVYTRWSQIPNNPELASCGLAIRVAARLDEAASTIVLKEFMSQALPTFNVYKQKKFNTVWPSTLTIPCLGNGEAGMRSCLLTPGTIGYVEYREASGIPVAQVVNSGNVAFSPSSSRALGWPDNCEKAAEATPTPFSTIDPQWAGFTLTKATDGYPLCGYSYSIVFNDLSRNYGGAMTSGRARNLVDYLHSNISDPVQASLPSYGYGYVPQTVRDTVKAGIDGINF